MQSHAVASRRYANLIEQSREIGIVFLSLIAFVKETRLQQLAQRVSVIG